MNQISFEKTNLRASPFQVAQLKIVILLNLPSLLRSLYPKAYLPVRNIVIAVGVALCLAVGLCSSLWPSSNFSAENQSSVELIQMDNLEINEDLVLTITQQQLENNQIVVTTLLENTSSKPLQIITITTDFDPSPVISNPLQLKSCLPKECLQPQSQNSNFTRFFWRPNPPDQFIELMENETLARIFTATVGQGGPQYEVKIRTTVEYTKNPNTDVKKIPEEIEGIIKVDQPLPQPIVFDIDVNSGEWGDFDHDGDLDLVIAGSNGLGVYENKQGAFSKIWEKVNVAIKDTKWGEFNSNSSYLEFVTAGDLNQISVYSYNSNTRNFEIERTFSTSRPLSEIEINFNRGENQPSLIGAIIPESAVDKTCRFIKIDPNNTLTDICNGAFYEQVEIGRTIIDRRVDLPCLVSSNTDIQLDDIRYDGTPITLADIDNDNKLEGIFNASYSITQTITTIREIYACIYYEFFGIKFPIGIQWIRSEPSSVQKPYKKYQLGIVKIDNSSTLRQIIPLSVEYGPPVNYSWGDFDRDGDVDLAITFPMAKSVRVFRNQYSATGPLFVPFTTTLTTTASDTPTGVDWGDFNGDGWLDLLVTDAPPVVFFNTRDPQNPFAQNIVKVINNITKKISNVRLLDLNQDANWEWAYLLADKTGVERLPFQELNFISPQKEINLGSIPASTISWADIDGNGFLDLVLGASPEENGSTFGSKLFYNFSGSFAIPGAQPFIRLNKSDSGPQRIAFADIDGDSDLDMALSSLAEKKLWIVKDVERTLSEGADFDKLSPELLAEDAFTSLAWGDLNGDGSLDLAAGVDNGTVMIFRNEKNILQKTPVIIKANTTITKSLITTIAWWDFDSDHHLDLAVSLPGYANQIYRNQGDNSFQLYWTSPKSPDTRSIAWANLQRNGMSTPVLAVGNYDAKNELYIFNSGSKTFDTLEISSTIPLSTTALAWGDVDGDSDLDLAVGHEGEAVQIFTSFLGNLTEAWRSEQKEKATAIAWSDFDNDGDLDLSVSQDGNSFSGIYVNNAILATARVGDFRMSMPLPNQPSYLSIERPGKTDNADFYSSPELLSGPKHLPMTMPTITIQYSLFDPDGSRNLNDDNAPGDNILSSRFEYSLDGGGVWQNATTTGGKVLTTTSRLGNNASFIWDAVADQAISDNARFRITIVYNNPYGPVQRASTSAISPPFRVRATTCYWPIDPGFTMIANSPTAIPLPGFTNLNQILFTGKVAQGSGTIVYKWQVFDNSGKSLLESEKQGQRIQFRDKDIKFDLQKNYTVRLQVIGEACPITRMVAAQQAIPLPRIYFPVIAKGTSVTEQNVVQAQTFPSASEQATQLFVADLPQITGLHGTEQANVVSLRWDSPANVAVIHGYRIHRGLRLVPEEPFTLLATLQANVTTYVDQASICDSIYYITAFNADGESLPSTTSYYTMPCQ